MKNMQNINNINNMKNMDNIDNIKSIIIENENLKKEVETLSENIKSIELEVGNKKEIEKTIARLHKEQEDISLKAIDDEKKAKERMDNIISIGSIAKDSLDEEASNISEARIAIEEEFKLFVEEKSKIDAMKNEYEKIRLEIEKTKEEMKSRNKEISESKENQSNELSTIKTLRSSQETERLNLEMLRKETIEIAETNRAILEEIKVAKDGSEKLMNDINEARQKAEDRRMAAQNEISSASYAQEMARNMMIVFRQALNTYIQIAGQEIKIPEITDENRRFIAKDLLSQCADSEKSEASTVEIEEVKAEMNELSELRKQYEEKFQKKVFNGWGVDEIKSKLK